MKDKPYDQNLPQILSLSVKRVGDWSTHSWRWLGKIRKALLNRVVAEKRKSTRTLRIDQRIAIEKLLRTILSHIDLKTMCIGYYDKDSGTFIHLGIEYLANKAELNLRRAQRALQWLYESGYIIGHRRSAIDENTGEYVHKTSIRKASLFLFIDLGITETALIRARNRSQKRVERTVLNVFQKSSSTNKPAIKKVLSEVSNLFTQVKPIPQQSMPKTYLEKLKKLKILFPDKSTNELKSMLPSPHSYK